MKVEIKYSWGEEESPVTVPEGQDGFDFMLGLALNEMKIEMKEHIDEGFASIS